MAQATSESTASGIYGVIVSAAVIAVAAKYDAGSVVAAVLGTLVIYWAAERYARLVADRIHEGHRPSWPQVRRQLTTGWEIVTASGLPLAVLVLLQLFGVGLNRAALWALGCSTLLLCLAGWEMGRNGQLSIGERVVSTLVAGMFGAVMIVLKITLH